MYAIMSLKNNQPDLQPIDNMIIHFPKIIIISRPIIHASHMYLLLFIYCAVITMLLRDSLIQMSRDFHQVTFKSVHDVLEDEYSRWTYYYSQ